MPATERRSSTDRSLTNSCSLALTQTFAKERRVEYRWALGVVQRQQQQQQQQQETEAGPEDTTGASSPSLPPPATLLGATTTTTTTATLATARPSERLSRRLALSVNPGWISASARSQRSAAAEAYAAPWREHDEHAALLLQAQRDADAAAARAALAALATGAGEARLPSSSSCGGGGDDSLAFHRRRDAFTAYVEAAAKARLVARGGYGGKAAGAAVAV